MTSDLAISKYESIRRFQIEQTQFQSQDWRAKKYERHKNRQRQKRCHPQNNNDPKHPNLPNTRRTAAAAM
jgi:hypothetical protein